jgi:Ca-activated chloride channel family protein
LLLDAVAADPDLPGGSRFYDAALAVLERLQDRTKDRKAIVALTDGRDSSQNTDIATLVAAAELYNIPVFPVGLGNVQFQELGTLANESGGLFYQAVVSDNLTGTYQQLADVLFDDQYVLSYGSAIPADGSGELEVVVEFTRDGRLFQGTATRTTAGCPAL